MDSAHANMSILPNMFNAWEDDLRKKIENGEAPFLGLFADEFRENTRKFIIKNLADYGAPVERIIEGLNRHPALFASHLTVFLTEGFGESGHFEVYSHISKALGLPSIPESKKKKLWRAFRHACLGLGLSVAPANNRHHQMVTEYLRQAGLPLRYADRLTHHMVRYAEDVGIPDERDPESIRVWQQGLLQRLNSPFPQVAKQAVELDRDGYYARLFLRLFPHPPRPELLGTKLEQKMAEAIGTAGTTRDTLRSVTIPRLVLRDFEVGLAIPPGRDVMWCMATDGEEQYYAGQEDECFIPVEGTLPREVIVKANGGNAIWRFPIWDDWQDNRFLLFGPVGGRFLKGACLSDGELFLEPGEYTVLLRFEPDGVDSDLELISEYPSLFRWHITLRPGQLYELRRGPARVLLRADNEPALEWLGESVSGTRGNDLFVGNRLKLRIFIPEEIRDACETGFRISLRSDSLGPDVLLPLDHMESDDTLLDLSFALKDWAPGVTRLLVEVRRADSQRTLIRGSAIVWHGLSTVKNRSEFICSMLPTNLLEKESNNISVDETSRNITYQNETSRFLRLTFHDGPRKLSFTWAVPGVFLYLERHFAGRYEERPLRIGGVLGASASSRDIVKIYASEAATIRLGPFKRRVDFSRYGIARLPLPPLLDYLRPNESVLELVLDRTGEALPLLNLVAPHETLSFSIKDSIPDGCLSISFTMPIPLEALRITSAEILRGEESEAEFCLKGEVLHATCEFSSGGRAVLRAEGETEYVLTVLQEGWSPGLWLLSFDAKINGRWGRLVNSRHDVYATGLVIETGGKGNFEIVLSHFLDAVGESEALLAFERVHRALMWCYAAECWDEGLSWLEDLWSNLLSRIKNFRSKGTRKLLEFSALKPSEGSSASWIPMLQIGVSYPFIFCASGVTYREIESAESVYLACLSCLGDLADHQLNALHIAPMVGCISPAPPPCGFSPAKYRQALTETDLPDQWRLLLDESWSPNSGNFLGALHYRYAIAQFERAYLGSLTGNNHRRGLALKLGGRALSGKLPDPSQKFLKNVNSATLDLGLFREKSTFMEGSEEELMQEHLQGLVRFLCLYAGVCRFEAREPGTLDEFICNTLAKTDTTRGDFKSALGFMLYTGEELFAFYLLLWEFILCADMKGRTHDA